MGDSFSRRGLYFDRGEKQRVDNEEEKVDPGESEPADPFPREPRRRLIDHEYQPIKADGPRIESPVTLDPDAEFVPADPSADGKNDRGRCLCSCRTGIPIEENPCGRRTLPEGIEDVTVLGGPI